MQLPKPKFRPKKVSATEPPSLDYGNFADLDIILIHYHANGLEYSEIPLPDLALKQPKIKKKKEQKVTKVVTEEVVAPEESKN